MAQTKIIVDSNSYFRLAQNIHPLLSQPFGKDELTLYVHADLNAEFKFNSRLTNKFHWVAESRYVANRSRSINLSKAQKKEIEETYDYLWEHVQDEFLEPRGKGPSPIDTRIVATALVLGIRLVTDDRDMIELAAAYDVQQISSMEMMKLMLDEGHIDSDKIDQVVEQWVYDNDTPHRDWRVDFKRLFGRKAPK
ncbi:MAG: PIN domain-containing protein [Verrucomicrobiae bacterium]|nr:PIN domain-containing protein [Verrucomicrobiae bacterium]